MRIATMHEFRRVLDVNEVPDPGKTLVEVDGEMVALFHVEGAWYAIDDVCTHDGGPLADGELRDFRIACPRHGAKFDIRTGAALTMPAVRATRAHDVKVEDAAVWVRLRSSSFAEGPAAHAAGSAAGRRRRSSCSGASAVSAVDSAASSTSRPGVSRRSPPSVEASACPLLAASTNTGTSWPRSSRSMRPGTTSAASSAWASARGSSP
jgi:3-phenylpropionate/trans-cinnamate dioxygenase ferredoxin subunit